MPYRSIITAAKLNNTCQPIYKSRDPSATFISERITLTEPTQKEKLKKIWLISMRHTPKLQRRQQQQNKKLFSIRQTRSENYFPRFYANICIYGRLESIISNHNHQLRHFNHFIVHFFFFYSVALWTFAYFLFVYVYLSMMI